MEGVDMMRPKLRIDKIAVQRHLASVSFAETLLSNARRDNLKEIAGAGEFERVIIGNGEGKINGSGR
jgi:hypothetical protein